MTADWAVDLGQQGVACVSLYPGLVRTEKMLASPAGPKIAKSNATETPEYTGRAVVALSLHHREMGRGGAVMEAGWSGRTVFGTDVGEAFGFVDTDGHVRPFRSAVHVMWLRVRALGWMCAGAEGPCDVGAARGDAWPPSALD